jgi:hypothetical protein
MQHSELMTVESTVFLCRPGLQMLVLTPCLKVPVDRGLQGLVQRQEQVTVVRPDGSSIAATAQINRIHVNIADPHAPIEDRWPIMVWLTDRTEDEVPVGSKILVDPAVRGAILGEDASGCR